MRVECDEEVKSSNITFSMTDPYAQPTPQPTTSSSCSITPKEFSTMAYTADTIIPVSEIFNNQEEIGLQTPTSTAYAI